MDEDRPNEQFNLPQDMEQDTKPEPVPEAHEEQVPQQAAAWAAPYAAYVHTNTEPQVQDQSTEPQVQDQSTEPQADGYGMDRLTPQQTQVQRRPPKKEKKKVSRVWIPILLVTAILLGLGGGVLGYQFASRRNLAAAPNELGSLRESLEAAQPETPDKPKAPILGQANADGTGLTPAQIYSEYVGAVVGIASETTGKNVWGQTVTQASSGSGFIITSDGYVVTNFHVVNGASNVTVQLYDGTEYPAVVVGYESTVCDVALLKIEAEGLPTVAIGDSDSIRVGEAVCAIGNPLGELTFTLTVGYISALDREINTDGTPINMFQTDAAINSGNSGGPLFDMNGNVIGITTAKYSGSTTGGTTVEGLGFAIPINDVVEIIDDLSQYGYVTGKPYLGVTADDAARYGDNLPAGAYIIEVQDGYAAQKADIRSGDVLVGLGQSVIRSQGDLQAVLAGYSAGETVSVTVFRAGQYLTLTLTLDERPRDADIQPQTEPTVQETEPNPFGGFDFGFGWPFP